jgi:hypothetical protein
MFSREQPRQCSAKNRRYYADIDPYDGEWAGLRNADF